MYVHVCWCILVCLGVYTVFVRFHAHCAWTTTEQSTYFKPIVIDRVSDYTGMHVYMNEYGMLFLWAPWAHQGVFIQSNTAPTLETDTFVICIYCPETSPPTFGLFFCCGAVFQIDCSHLSCSARQSVGNQLIVHVLQLALL